MKLVCTVCRASVETSPPFAALTGWSTPMPSRLLCPSCTEKHQHSVMRQSWVNGDGMGVAELKEELELLEQLCQDLTGEQYMRQQGTYETEMSKLRADLKDVHDTYKQIVDERCAGDEKHCTCVPALRQEIKKLREQLADSISRETVIATEQERDEWMQVATEMEHERDELKQTLQEAQQALIREGMQRDEARNEAEKLRDFTEAELARLRENLEISWTLPWLEDNDD